MCSFRQEPGQPGRLRALRWCFVAGGFLCALLLVGVWYGPALAPAGPAIGSSGASLAEGENPVRQRFDPPSVEQRLLRSVRFLAADEMEGRGLGTDGIERAAEHIAQEFQRAGLTTDHFNGTAFQRFGGFRRWGVNGPCRLALLVDGAAEQDAMLYRDYTPLSLSGDGDFQLPVVFVGFGITAPQLDYDEYAQVDARSKAVLVLRHAPPHLANLLSGRDADLDGKVANAVAHGASAVLFITDLRTLRRRAEEVTAPGEQEQVDLDRFDRLLAFTVRGQRPERPIPVVHVQRQPVAAIVRRGSGQTLAELETRIEQTNQPQSCELTGCAVTGETSVGAIHRDLRNVVATLEGAGPHAHETIVVGAHYDHIGYGGSLTSLSPNSRAVHNGADDNASGVAVVLELARQLSSRDVPLDRRVLFIAFTAEESGLIGSQYYVEHPLVPLSDTVAMLNYDMVGYLRNDRLEVHGVGTANEFRLLLDSLGRDGDLQLLLHSSGYGPSDHASFAEQGVPTLHFFTGLHDHYHRPSDDYDKLNYRGMQRITSLSYQLIVSLANAPTRPSAVNAPDDFGLVDLSALRPRSPIPVPPGLGLSGQISSLGGYLVEQLAPRGRAERSGIRRGDRLVQINGQRVGTADDYQAAVTSLRAGTPVVVRLLRSGVELEINLVGH